MVSFLIPFVILEIIRPVLKISPKMTFHNAIMRPFNSVMLNSTHVHTHIHTLVKSVSSEGRNIMLCSLLYPQHLEQSLACCKFSVFAELHWKKDKQDIMLKYS